MTGWGVPGPQPTMLSPVAMGTTGLQPGGHRHVSIAAAGLCHSREGAHIQCWPCFCPLNLCRAELWGLHPDSPIATARAGAGAHAPPGGGGTASVGTVAVLPSGV